MARAKNPKRRYKVATMIEGYYYDFLTRAAEKGGYSLSEGIRRAVVYAVDKQFKNAINISLEESQMERLYEIAKSKDMSIGEISSRVLSNYIDTYF